MTAAPLFRSARRWAAQWLMNLGAQLSHADWTVSAQIENLLNDGSVAWAASRQEYERNVITMPPRTLRIALQRRW